MVALDGRLASFLLSSWALAIQGRFGELQELAGLAPTDELFGMIASGHNMMLDEHLENLASIQALAGEAMSAGVPTWGEIYTTVPDDAGGAMPMFMMVPATVLEDWATMLIETAALVEDARASIDAGEPVGIVATLEAQERAERGVRGPVLVGIAAIGLTVFGIFMAVRSGRVSRGTQVQQDLA